MTIRSKVLKGNVEIPGDKSLSHRALMMASLPFYPQTQKSVEIQGLLMGEDVMSTLKVLQACGKANFTAQETLVVSPLSQYQEPSTFLDCGNSGTSIRLLSGLFAAQKHLSILSGDESLKKRPMKRVIAPLNQMGANIYGRCDNQFAPIVIAPCSNDLLGQKTTLETASAQVKSAIMLASLFAEGETQLMEPIQSRDHTERVLQALGVRIQSVSNSFEKPSEKSLIWSIQPPEAGSLALPEIWTIPGDISSAAFLMVAATCIPGSEVLLKGVNLNPTRTGILEVLQTGGMNLKLENQTNVMGEPAADLVISAAALKGTLNVSGAMIPRLIDELPILSVAGLFLEGTLTVQDAEELRIKESDRIHALETCYQQLELPFTATSEGFVVQGNPDIQAVASSFRNKNFTLDGAHDHRIVMAMMVLNLILRCADEAVPEWDIQGREWVNISFPGFEQVLSDLLA
jgi:3-phosphoshikimate 1-carboxyvinyltransferase